MPSLVTLAGWGGVSARATHFWREQAGGLQGAVADDFSLQSEARGPGQPLVARVLGLKFGGQGRGLAVGFTGHDEAVQGFLPGPCPKKACQ